MVSKVCAGGLNIASVCLQEPGKAGKPGGHLYPGWSRRLPVRQTWLPGVRQPGDPQRQRQLFRESGRRVEPGCHALHHPGGALPLPRCGAGLPVQQNPQGPLQRPRDAVAKGQMLDPLRSAPGPGGAPDLAGDSGAPLVCLGGAAGGRSGAQ